MKPPLLDTHIWVWWLDGDERLGEEIREALNNLPLDSRPVVSAISLWEVATLVRLGRLELDRDLESWLHLATHHATVKVRPITAQIAAEEARLPATFHRDPADRLIVATGRQGHFPVLTVDRRILDSKLVQPWQP
jgi:PIN domain nuclease of toxin-antitoxin system